MKKSIEKKSITAIGIAVAVIVGLVCGYFWGFANGGAATTASFKSKINLRSLIGQVEEINGATLTLGMAPGILNPFAAWSPAVWEMTVTSSTKMIGTKSGARAGSGTLSPVSFVVMAISPADIKIGDIVSVSADRNILSEPSFTAVSVQDEGPSRPAITPVAPPAPSRP